MKSRRVGGSGWAGVHGSFIGISKPSQKATGSTIKKPKIKRLHPNFSGHSTLAEARAAGLSRKQWQSQSAKHVARLEREIVALKAKLEAARSELVVAEKARQEAFGVAATNAKRREGLVIDRQSAQKQLEAMLLTGLVTPESEWRPGDLDRVRHDPGPVGNESN